MEEIKETNKIEQPLSEENVKIYRIDGSVVRVKREFSHGGTNILERVMCLLLDILEQENQKEITS
ncbi:MAG: hypothetical protein IKA31_03965 [Clostridia bacterium]|nr:hypothetical protein [Clostridia bacterium]MBR1984877.1 hypothetical protein [Clostridia bacterium]